MKGFGSDNHAGVHPDLLDAILKINVEHEPSYGTDPITNETREIFKKFFGDSAETFFVYNGTAANVLCLRACIQPYEACLVSDTSHLHLDECGAPEFFAGKLIPIPSIYGKIIASEIEKYIIRKGDQHFAQVKMISLTQSTELGTCYTIDEMREIIQIAKKHQLLVHIDGARFSNASYTLKKSFKELTTDLGIDIVSFGGTKNGFLFGEAIIILNPKLSSNFKYIQKQSAQLPSKSRFLTTQFKAYLENNLYLKIAEHSCLMAKMLETELNKIPQVKITRPVESNAVFAIIPKSWLKTLRTKYFFYVWDEITFECRLMMSWDSTIEDIKGFISMCQELQKNNP